MNYSRALIKAFMEENCKYTTWPSTWDTTDKKQFEDAVDFMHKFIQGLDQHYQVQPGYCAIHHRIEIDGPNQEVYHICFECKHVYLTERELVDAYNENAPNKPVIPLKTKGSEIYFCPYCLHDF